MQDVVSEISAVGQQIVTARSQHVDPVIVGAPRHQSEPPLVDLAAGEEVLLVLGRE